MNIFNTKVPIITSSLYHLFDELHSQSAYGQFLVIMKGSLNLTCQEKTYQLGDSDIQYIPCEAAYTLEPESACYLMYVSFHPFFLLGALGLMYQSVTYISTQDSQEKKVIVLESLCALSSALLSSEEEITPTVYAKAYDLLSLFTTGKFDKSMRSISRSEKIMDNFYQFLGNHFSFNTTLTNAANELGYTPQYLASFLKKNTGLTYQEHLNQYRINAALLLIKYSEESTVRIAVLCGFPNSDSLRTAVLRGTNLTFDEIRRTGVTHSDKDFGKILIQITNTQLCFDYLFNYLHYSPSSTVAFERLATESISVNLQKSKKYIPNWNHIINLGNILDFDKPEYRYAIKNMQEALHFSYGRIVGIMLLVVQNSDRSENPYNFSKIFEVTDFLLKLRMKPFFELSNKPFHIYLADENIETDIQRFLEPEKYDVFFYSALPYFIRACIGRYGFDEFSSWRFELWRRYNPNMTSCESVDVYTTRFQRTRDILKQLTPDIQIGGPGFNTFMPSEYFQELLNEFQHRDIIPDFFTAYYFPYLPTKDRPEPEENGYGYTTVVKEHQMSEKTNELLACMKRSDFESHPLIYTEYSAYLSTGNYINDSVYPAIFIFQQASENMEKVHSLAYWLACDISLSYHDYQAPFFGGNGIISKNAIPKSSYFAFQFLNQLGDRMISSGKHYIITTKNEVNIQLLVFYPTSLNTEFASSPVNVELLHSPFSAFVDIPTMFFEMKLLKMKSGKYLYKEQSLNLTTGNILASWGRLDFIRDLKMDELDYIRHESIPTVRLKNIVVSSEYQIEVKLNYNEAKLITLELHL
ncbi:MAG: GH39 family glycosyl hydrolase [Lachnospiraceae bacterium]